MIRSSLPDKSVYAYGLHFSGGAFYNEHSFFASNDFLMSEFINGDLLSALEFYYGAIEDYDSHDCEYLLLRRKIKEWRRQELLGELSLENISATGLPQVDADRYYSS